MGLSRKLVFVGLSASAFAIACNGIIGLSDYQYGECPGAKCSDGSFPDFDSNVPDGNNPPVDGGKDTGPGAQPVSWAQWPMPGYDGGPGAPLTYDDLGSELYDQVTKLTWKKAFEEPGNFTYTDAVNACKKLGAWRLPKRIELVTLIDYSKPSGTPKISDKFTISNDTVWTSSEFRSINPADPSGPTFDPANPSYWVVDFSSGQLGHREAKASNRLEVLCVKAVQ